MILHLHLQKRARKKVNYPPLKVTDAVRVKTKEVTEEVTKQVTEQVTKQVTKETQVNYPPLKV